MAYNTNWDAKDAKKFHPTRKKWTDKIPRGSKIVQLDRAIVNVIGYLGIEKKLEDSRVFDVWEYAVGESIANVTNLDSIRDGVLYVAVSDASWRHELMYLKAQIIEKLNRELRAKIVSDIKFSLKQSEDEGLPTVNEQQSR